MEAHSLYELNEYVKRVIALNFREPLWIRAEASEVKFSRNNYYINLVEKKEGKDEIIAQANAVIWARNYFFLKKKLGDVLDDILVDGTEILIKVKLDFNERYGLKLFIEDIDPSYTFGQAELKRQETIERLKKEGLHELNGQLPLPQVLQRIAVLSSKTAAGYKDFTNQLAGNSYGYLFDVELYPIAVQGSQLEAQFIKAFNAIESHIEKYDCIAIVRGGGSKLDLSWFDTYAIGERIAKSKLPVLTGIGHEIDYSIADITAHTHLKTPTAVADFLIENNLFFESNIIELVKTILNAAQMRFNSEEAILMRYLMAIENLSDRKMAEENHLIDILEQDLFTRTNTILDRESGLLEGMEKLLMSLLPESVLKRGYAVIYKNGSSIHSEKKVAPGDEFELELHDGRFASKRI